MQIIYGTAKIIVYSSLTFRKYPALLWLHRNKPQYVDSLAAVWFWSTGFTLMWFEEIGF